MRIPFFLVFAFFLLELDENIVKGKFWFPRNYYLYGCFAYLHIVYKAVILWVLTRKKICLTIIWKKVKKQVLMVRCFRSFVQYILKAFCTHKKKLSHFGPLNRKLMQFFQLLVCVAEVQTGVRCVSIEFVGLLFFLYSSMFSVSCAF